MNNYNVFAALMCLTAIIMYGMELGTITDASMSAVIAIIGGVVGAGGMGAYTKRNGKS